MDVMTPDQRRRAMASNGGRTRPERALASALWQRGLRYLTDKGYKRKYGRSLIGHPDLVFTRRRAVVFVDGCFWHGCKVCGRYPGGSGQFWRDKIDGNVERDRLVTEALQASGWIVIRVPEHEFGTATLLRRAADRLESILSR